MPPIIGFNPNRLKVQLKLAINRIKLAQQKKNVSSKLQRKEIATLLENNKEESARIRVEGIIHDDYYVEAMEVLELYCELLIAPVNTLLYASSRLDIKELLPIRDQFISKFGKEFVKNAVENVNDCVNERIVQKLIVDNPDSFLVERYLEEIAKSFNVDWNSKHNNYSDKETIDLDDLSIKLNNNNSKEKDEYTALPDLNDDGFFVNKSSSPSPLPPPPPFLFKKIHLKNIRYKDLQTTFVLRTVREIVIAAWAIQKPEVKPLNQEDLKCKQLMREVINAESDLVGLLGIDFSVKLPEIVLQYKSNEIALAAVYIIISRLSLRCTENFTDLCKKFGKANPVSVMKLFEKLS
ncbi:5161_t:CDS:2 [Entrophospora sp. SA101]|nr:5161_t:CDS:2 [Entrophospora sp. SA101]